MTGFGDAACEADGVHYSLELRSVNNRYFKVSCRLPDELAALEGDIELQLRRRITRGSLTAVLHFKDTSASAAHEINEPALRHYLSHVKLVEKEAQSGPGERGSVTIDLGSLLSLPGIVQPPDQTALVTRARPAVGNLLEQACDKLLAMRRTEGQTLVDDLTRHCHLISERIGIIEGRAPEVVETYHQKLRTRVDQLMARAQIKLEEADLIREVAIFAEKSDTAEELQRLRAHLDQFGQILRQQTNEPAGRTLDFLAQELLREANTIASKCNDVSISQVVVEIKGAIDRIKEQVQNIE